MMCEMPLHRRMSEFSGEGGVGVCICTLSIFLGPKIVCIKETLSTIVFFLYERIANVLVSAYTVYVFLTEDQRGGFFF